MQRARLVIICGAAVVGKSAWVRHAISQGFFDAERALADAEPAGRTIESRVAALRALTAKSSAPLVLELGAAVEPAPIIRALRADAELWRTLQVGDVLTLVDAARGRDAICADAVTQAQIASADVVIVTKTDLADAAEVGRLLEALRTQNPFAEFRAAVVGVDAELPPFHDVPPEAPPAPADPFAAPFRVMWLPLGEVDWPVFGVWLSALLNARGEDVLRVKGVLRTPLGRVLVQTVGRIAQPPEVLPERLQAEVGVVRIVGRGFTEQDLRRSLTSFAAAARSSPDA